jgi:hypothetical protein
MMGVSHFVLALALISRVGGKIPLTLAGFASIDILDGGWSSAGCIPAIDMALRDVNTRTDVLDEYELGWVMKDTRVNIISLYILAC